MTNPTQQPESYATYDYPDQKPRGNLVVATLGEDGATIATDQNPLPTSQSGVKRASFVSTNALLVANANTKISFATPVTHILFQPDVDTNIELDGTAASAADGLVQGGGSFNYVGPPVPDFTYLSPTADGLTNKYNLFAW